MYRTYSGRGKRRALYVLFFLMICVLLFFIRREEEIKAPQKTRNERTVFTAGDSATLGGRVISFDDISVTERKDGLHTAHCVFSAEYVSDQGVETGAAVRAVIYVSDSVSTRQISVELFGEDTASATETLALLLPEHWRRIEIVFTSDVSSENTVRFAVERDVG